LNLTTRRRVAACLPACTALLSIISLKTLKLNFITTNSEQQQQRSNEPNERTERGDYSLLIFNFNFYASEIIITLFGCRNIDSRSQQQQKTRKAKIECTIAVCCSLLLLR